jgi:class 3 adenylate cyclase
VNLAARLQASCEPDDVLISHATAVLVQDEIPCIARGEIAVKGFVQPVKVYAVAAPTSAAAAGGSARG